MSGLEFAQFLGWFFGYLLSAYLLVGVLGLFLLKSALPAVKAGILTVPFFALVIVGEIERFNPIRIAATILAGLAVFALYRWRLIRLRRSTPSA